MIVERSVATKAVSVVFIVIMVLPMVSIAIGVPNWQAVSVDVKPVALSPATASLDTGTDSTSSEKHAVNQDIQSLTRTDLSHDYAKGVLTCENEDTPGDCLQLNEATQIRRQFGASSGPTDPQENPANPDEPWIEISGCSISSSIWSPGQNFTMYFKIWNPGPTKNVGLGASIIPEGQVDPEYWDSSQEDKDDLFPAPHGYSNPDRTFWIPPNNDFPVNLASGRYDVWFGIWGYRNSDGSWGQINPSQVLPGALDIQYPDITPLFDSLSIVTTYYQSSTRTEISIDVENQGLGDTGDFYVSFWSDWRGSYGTKKYLGESQVSLKAGAQTPTPPSVTTYNVGLGAHIFDIHADHEQYDSDPFGCIVESNEGNNWAWVEPPRLKSKPSDVSYEHGTTGHILRWTASAEAPRDYEIRRNGIWWDGTYWYDDSEVSTRVDGLSVGTHSFVIKMYDTMGNYLQDEVIVEVTEPPPQPDLIVTGIAVSPASPTGNQPTSITAQIKNNDDGNAGRFYVSFYDGTSFLGSKDIGWLNAYQTTSVTLTTSEIPPGARTLIVVVDEDDYIDESHDYNNELEKTHWFKGPDIQITGFWSYHLSAANTRSSSLYATVKNLGDAPSQGFRIDFLSDYRGIYGSEVELGSVWVEGLDIGEMEQVSVIVQNMETGYHILEVHSDSEEDVDETDEGNNWHWETGCFVRFTYLDEGMSDAKPCRRAYVLLDDFLTAENDIESFTDDMGYVLFTDINENQLYAAWISADDYRVTRVQTEFPGSTYSWSTQYRNPDQTWRLNFDLEIDLDNRGAWEIYHNILDVYDWLVLPEPMGRGVDLSFRSQVTVRWPIPLHILPDDQVPHSHGDEIHVWDGGNWLGSIWFRWMAIHEYAHCIHWAARDNSFPPERGNLDEDEVGHTLYSELAVGDALAEGWADFLMCAVDNDPELPVRIRYESIESYTYADGGYINGIYFGDPDPANPTEVVDWDGRNVEGAIAQVFWDIWDGYDEDDCPEWLRDLRPGSQWGDRVVSRFDRLWTILVDHDPDNIDDFWNTWVDLYGLSTDMWAVFYQARINYDEGSPENAPVTTILDIQGNEGTNDWYKGLDPVLIRIEADDDMSGIWKIRYRVDGGDWKEYADQTILIGLEGSGIYFIEFSAIDRAGNQEEEWGITIKWDMETPATLADYPEPDGQNGWYISATQVVLSVQESVSGYYKLCIRYDNEPWYDWYNPDILIGVLFDVDGSHWIEYYAVDMAGNIEQTKRVEIDIEISDPEASIDLVGQCGIEDWYSSDVTVTLFSEATISGVSYIEWIYDSGELSRSYADSFSFTSSGESIHLVTWEVVSNAGRSSGPQTGSFGIDRTRPGSPTDWNSLPDHGMWTSEMQFQVDWSGASDDASGVWGYSLVWSQDIWTVPDDTVDWLDSRIDVYAPEDGLWYLYILSVDKAGNTAWSPVKAGPFMVDTIAPETAAVLPVPDGSNDWYLNAFDLSFEWFDTSGVISTYYAVDDGEFVEYAAPVIFSQDGEHAIHFYSMDLAGLIEESKSVEVKLDLFDPHVEWIDSMWYDAATTGNWVTLPASDDYPGYYVIALDGGDGSPVPWDGTEISWSIDGLEIGQHEYGLQIHSLSGRFSSGTIAVEVIGNTPSGSDIYVYDDLTEISIVFAQVSSCGITSFMQLSTPLTPPAGFRIVGVGAYDITTTATYVGPIAVAVPYDDYPFTNPKRELHLKLMHETLSGSWEDITTWIDTESNIIYGECSTLSIFLIVEDNIPPTTSIDFEGTEGISDWYTSAVTITLTSTDDGSEVVGIAYSFDQVLWTAYTIPFEHREQGEFTIYFNATDAQGNTEDTKWANFKIDRPSGEADKSVIVGTQDGYIMRKDYDSSSGTFVTVWESYFSGYTFRDIALNDTDSDSVPEVYASCYNNGLILMRVDFNNGSRVWEWMVPHTVTYGHFHRMFFEDVDVDGVKEIITVHNPSGWSNPSVYIHDNTGSVLTGYTPGYRADVAMLADYNGDGVRDLYFMSGAAIYGTYPQPRILVVDMRNLAMNTLMFIQDSNLGGMTDFALANIDSDDLPEMFVAGWWTPVVAYDHDGTVLWKREYSGGNADRLIFTCQELLLSGTGIVTTASYSDAPLKAYHIDLNTGNILGSFSLYGRGSYVWDVFDLNGDGILEVAVVDWTAGTAFLHLWNLGTGQEVWSQEVCRRDQFSGLHLDNHHQFTDCDGDGIKDLLFVDHNNDLWKAAYDENHQLVGAVSGGEAFYWTMFESEGPYYPQTTATLDGILGEEGWYRSDVTITLDAIDDVSGVTRTEYSLDSVNWLEYLPPLVISAEGFTNVCYRSIDVAGNEEPYKSISVSIDRSPPTTTIHPVGTEGYNDWYLSYVTVTLSAVDGLSGPYITEYSLDGTNWLIYHSEIRIETEGDTTVYARSTDIAGNVEGLVSEFILIDTGHPSSPDAFTTTNLLNYWTSQNNVYVTWSGAADAVSGVYGYAYEWDSSPTVLPDGSAMTLDTVMTEPPGTGVWYLHIRTRDVAGNFANNALHIGPFKIDTTNPNVFGTVIGPKGLGNWYLDSVTVVLYGFDMPVGIDYIRYSYDGLTWTTYEGPFSVASEAAYNTRYYAVDYVGHESPIMSLQFSIDRTPPTAIATVSGAQDTYGTYLGSATIDLDASDDRSGPNFIEYRLNDGPWHRYDAGFSVDVSGSYTLEYYAVDSAGNAGTTGTVQFQVEAVEEESLGDDFTSDATGYDSGLWTVEEFGPGEVIWEQGTILAIHAWDHGYRTLITNRIFSPGCTAVFRAKFSDWNALPAFGWTDAEPQPDVHGPWNYHPTIGPNGVWVEFNWPYARQLSLYTQSNYVLSRQTITVPDYTNYHDYEISWDQGIATLSIDDVVVASLTTNVPTVPLPVKMLVTAWAGEGQGQRLRLDSFEIDSPGIILPALDLEWDTGNIGIVQDIAIGDVDDDGVTEVLTAIEPGYGATGHVRIYNGVSKELETMLELPAGYARTAAIGDPDHDGATEILIGASGWWETGEIARIYQYRYDGVAATLEWQSPIYNCYHNLWVADVDSDGQREIVALTDYEREGSNIVDGRVLVFDGATHALEWDTGGFGTVIGGKHWLGNLDSDWNLELVFAGRTSLYSPWESTIWIVDASTHAVQSSLYVSGYAVTTLTAGDIDLDGEMEIIAGLRHNTDAANYIRVYDTNLNEEWYHVLGSNNVPYEVRTSNVDSDPQLEIIVGNAYASGNWAGDFFVIDSITRDLEYTRAPKNVGNCIELGDANDDGYLDLAVGYHAGWSDGSMEVYDTGVAVSASLSLSLAWDTGNIGVVQDIRIGDVDGDGRAETVLAIESSYGVGHVKIYEGVAQTPERTIYMTDGYARCLALGDPDHDGMIEIVVGTSATWQSGAIGRIRVFDGATGMLEWQSSQHDGIYTVSVADVDADGRNEIVGIAHVEREGSTRVSGTVMIYDGQTKLLEWESNSFGLALGAYGWIGNIDDDFQLEIVFAGRSAWSPPYLTTLWVVDGLTHQTQASLPVGEYDVRSVISADTNLDGEPEVLVGARESDESQGYVRAYDPNLNHLWTVSLGSLLLPNRIEAANLDHDPTLELAVAIQDNHGSWWGHFRIIDATTHNVLYTRGNKNNAPVVYTGDVDHDGFLEIAVGYHASFSQGSLEVYDTDVVVSYPATEDTAFTASPTDIYMGDSYVDSDGTIWSVWTDVADYNAMLSSSETFALMPPPIDMSDESDGEVDNDAPFSIHRAYDGTLWIAYRVGTTWTSERNYVRSYDESTGLGPRHLVPAAAQSNAECDFVQLSDGSFVLVFSASNSIYSASSWRVYSTTSSDMISWSIPVLTTSQWGRECRLTVDNNDRLYAIIDNNDLGMFLLTSDDGVTWSVPVLATPGHYGDIHYSPAHGRLFLGYCNTTDMNIWMKESYDGVTWSSPWMAVDRYSSAGGNCRVCEDSQGRLIVTYRDAPDGVLNIYARRITLEPEVVQPPAPTYPPPSTPVLADPGSSVVDGVFTVTWTTSVSENGPIDYYVLQMSESPSFTHISSEWSDVGTSISVGEIFDGTYYFRVRAVDVLGAHSFWSDIEDIIVLKDQIPPTIDSPPDITYEAGDIGHSIEWNPGDGDSSSYEIYFDGELIEASGWSGSSVYTSIEGLSPGDYSITLIVRDIYDNYVSDTVFVIVEPAAEPMIDSPPDSAYEAGTTGNAISWNPSDLSPSFYVAYLDGVPYMAEDWSGLPIKVPVDGLDPGVYLFSIEIFDRLGLSVTDGVEITVVDTTPPEIPVVNVFRAEATTTGNWGEIWAQDLYPGNYEVFFGGAPVSSGNWDETTPIVFNYDGHDPGEYLYGLYCYDAYSNLLYLQLSVVVVDTTPPEIDHPDDLTYTGGDTGHSTTWTPSDAYPSYYEVFVESSLFESGAWSGGSITVVVDGINIGVWEFTIFAYDAYTNFVTDLVLVEVMGNTPFGEDVVVEDPETGITFEFEETASAGWTNVTESETGPQPPDGFRVMGVYYDMVTTVDFEGLITVAFPYDEADVRGREENLRIWHWREIGGWEDVTSWVDTVGNIIYGVVTDLSPFAVMEDAAPPATSIELSGLLGEEGWYLSEVTVTLDAIDAISDIAEIAYSFDKINWVTYTGPFTISNEGLTTVYYNSTDIADNMESPNRQDVWIDTKCPDTSATLDPSSPTGNNGWYASSVTLSLSYSDVTSEVSRTFLRVNSGPVELYVTPVLFSADGFYAVEYWSIDNAGNTEQVNTISFRIDQSEPITTLLIQEPSHGSDPTYVKNTTDFILDADDVMSKLAWIEYQIDGTGWMTYSVPFQVSTFGPHDVDYRSVDCAGNVEDYHRVSIIVNAASLTYLDATTGEYSDEVILSALMIDMATEQPIDDKTILFTIGDQSVTGTTENGGVASATIILDQPAGLYEVTASFPGDADYVAASGGNGFAVEKEHVTAEYTGSTVVPTTVETFTLRATVFDEDDGNWGYLSNVYVTFEIYSVPIDTANPVAVIGPIKVDTTDVDGVGVATAEAENLPENGYVVLIRFETGSNNFYSGPPSDLVTITIYEPTGDFVTGGGWIWDPSGSKGNFGFNVKYKKNGLPRGQAIYIFRVGDWEYIVKSNAWLGMAIDGNHSCFEAKCTVQQFNSKTGELVWGEGNYQLRIDVWDGEEDGEPDEFQIRVYDKNGVVWHEAGFSPRGYLQGGNIVIHRDKEK